MSEWIPYQTIYINSTSGAQGGVVGTGSNFSVSLAGSPIIPRPGQMVKAAVTSCSIPLTYQGVNSANNQVYVTENNGTINDSFTVSLIQGQYSASTFATMVGTVLSAASTASGFGLTYTATLNTDTGLLEITPTTGYTVTFSGSSPTTAFTPLGMTAGTNVSFTNAAPYISANIVNIEGPLELTLRCGNFITNIYESRVQSDSAILAVIPIVGAQYQILSYAPAYPKAFGVIGSRLDRLDFLLTDQNGLIINLNGYGITIQLALYSMPIPS